MSASKRAKELGAKSVKQIAEMLNLHADTLQNWYREEPKRFDIAAIGCVEYLKKTVDTAE